MTGPRVALIGTAPPRRCGIASFTDDLRVALTGEQPEVPAVQVALTDVEGAYEYGPEVVFEVQAAQRSDYGTAAAFLDSSDVDVVCVQHEFGIFGGPAGRHLEELLDRVHAPVVTTLHTVLADPSPEVRAATRRVVERSAAVVVLAERAVELLVDACDVDPDKIHVIAHGVPSLPDVRQETAKEATGLSGRTVLLTFGLLGPDKGIEVVLDALPEVVRQVPDLLYVVLGATHPHVLRQDGERYRDLLRERVCRLGLADHVQFVDRYVDLDELRLHLAACDAYVTPYHSTQQIVSGTLAYAVGMGRVVVSTPFPYARELLADGRGVLTPFGDPEAMSVNLVSVLLDDARRADMQRRARAHGASMTWPAVARSYLTLFADVLSRHEVRPAGWVPVQPPRPRFEHLQSLTDDVGVFQHAQHGVASRAHGYCTDDVARALVAGVQGAARLADPVARSLVPRYLSFLLDAQRADGRFENLMGYDRRFVAGTASEDTLGQAVWGLGTTAAIGEDAGWRALATEMVGRSLPAVAELQATKALSYALVGLHGYLEAFPGALGARRVVRVLADRLLSRLGASSRNGWAWPDDAMTYANAVVPEALVLAGTALEEPSWVSAGLRCLDTLLEHTYVDGRFDFPGNEGWLQRDGRRARWGQQPVEAGLTARACMVAHEVTGSDLYLDRAHAAADWLLGRNRLGLALLDARTGRCADGLDRHGVSTNSGAESTICALLALVALPAQVAPALPPTHEVV